MPQATANGIRLEYESRGDEKAETILLIMGLGAQMTRWADDFVDRFVKRGFRVVRFDNRDIGLSERLEAAGPPDIPGIIAALHGHTTPPAAYTLGDMAADAVGLLDALGIAKAHIVGASMGGMIAQLVAADYPDHTLSLTSIMSTTGHPDLPRATPEAMAVLNERGPTPTEDMDGYLAHAVRSAKTIGSPGYPFDAATIRANAKRDVERSFYPGRIPPPVRGRDGLSRTPVEDRQDHGAHGRHPRRRRSPGARRRRSRHRRAHPRRRAAHHPRHGPRHSPRSVRHHRRRRHERRATRQIEGLRMSEKNVLIVGASRGIGLGLVKEYVAEGAHVTATVRDAAKATDLAALASSSGGKIKIETVDTADGKSAEALRERLADETFDIVIVNAGIGGPQANPRNVSDDDFNQLFLTNSLGPVRLAELLVKQVKPNTGVIGLMTSQLGSVEGAKSGGVELYRASKAALNSFTRSFAARHKDKGVAVLSLHPGWVKTDMGGAGADIDVETSTKGLVEVIKRAEHDRKDGFFNYKGETIPW